MASKKEVIVISDSDSDVPVATARNVSTIIESDSDTDGSSIKEKQKQPTRRNLRRSCTPKGVEVSGAKAIRKSRDSMMNSTIDRLAVSAVKGFIKSNDDGETACMRFLENNYDSDDSFIVQDSDEVTEEDSGTSESETREEFSGNESEDTLVEEPQSTAASIAEVDEEHVSPTKRRRCHMISSSEDEVDTEGASQTQTADAEEDVSELYQKPKKKRRSRKLKRIMQLPESQSQEDGSQEGDDSKNTDVDVAEMEDDESIVTLSESSEDSMSGFIVDDPILSGDDETNTEQHQSAIKKSHKLLLSVSLDHLQAFKVVVESLISQVDDSTFFCSDEYKENPLLQEGNKKIFDSLQMVTADLKSQAWSEEFIKSLERLNYRSEEFSNISGVNCQACHRRRRYAQHEVRLSGQRYSKVTLQDIDSEDSGEPDDVYMVGVYCEERSQLYHEALHFKKNLYEQCKEKMTKNGFPEKSIEDIVEEVMDDEEWIELEYRHYEGLKTNATKVIQQRSGITETGSY